MSLPDRVVRDFPSAQRNFEALDPRIELVEGRLLGGTLTLTEQATTPAAADGSVVIYAATTGGQTVIMAVNATTSGQLWP